MSRLRPFHAYALGLVFLLVCVLFGSASSAQTSAVPQAQARDLFGTKKLPADMSPSAYGFYSRGCVSGAVALPEDGPAWQTMRLSRNRYWGHPDMIDLIVRLSEDTKSDDWNGILVGDISQPRGGPMLTGHVSHQIGLDVDVWLMPMPEQRLSRYWREKKSAISMLRGTGGGGVDQSRIGDVFGYGQFNLIRTAARYGEVERVFVHPVIKRELCSMETGNRGWLSKVRPWWGHHYHMHIRMKCPADSPNCRPQKKPESGDGCGAEIDDWIATVSVPPVPAPKRPPKKPLVLADLPAACRVVLDASSP